MGRKFPEGGVRSLVLSLLLIVMGFVLAAATNVFPMTERYENGWRDLIGWILFALAHGFCVLELLLAWFGQRPLETRQVRLLYLTSLVIWFLWWELGGVVECFFLVIPQFYLVYLWCIRPEAPTRLETQPVRE